MAKKTAKTKTTTVKSETYIHKEATSLLRPEVGTQAQFRKKKEPKTYRYDSSLAPELNWDGQNPAREQGEALIEKILKAKDLEEAKQAARNLRALSRPFLNWAGKAERLSFDVPSLPLFIHERLSTKAIIETLKTHQRNRVIELDLFGDTQYSISDQVLKSYEYQDKWTNRMVLGDSLVVMNSLLQYEGMGGQVQMIYMDPPYGVKFGSNFQPFIRRRDVKHNEDEDMTREPEMVKAYRDTWELGLHSYLTYMRDRLILSRELLTDTGSIFVQISDENIHHIKELMDEVFGEENYSGIICFTKAGGGLESTKSIASRIDYIIWFAKNKSKLFYNPLFEIKDNPIEGGFTMVETPDDNIRSMTTDEKEDFTLLPKDSKIFMSQVLTKPGPGSKYEVEFEGQIFNSGKRWWGMPKESLEHLIKVGRVFKAGNTLRFKRYYSDFPFTSIDNLWTGFGGQPGQMYVVQTNSEIIKRCMLMTTKPGDLVIDPTCGSGTSAYVAECWGRRWITVDTSRVPLALAKQRLLTATFPYFQLSDEMRGPIGGFAYSRKQNRKGDEIGGIVPHITSSSIANQEQPKEEILVDRPEIVSKITRVTGPFVFEATIPTPMDWDENGETDSIDSDEYFSFVQRMLEVLRKSPVLHLEGGKTIQFKNVRLPVKSLSLSAEAMVDGTTTGLKSSLSDAIVAADEKNKGMLPLSQKVVALVFGPENGAVSEKLVFEAAKEASAKKYTHLYVIGFAIQANARQLIDNCEQVTGIGATYVQATPDLMMGDLLKNMRSSQIFSVCGLPEVKLKRVKVKGEPDKYQAILAGLDLFDPISMEVEHRRGDDVPAWFLDTDYNEMVFHVTQAFFPRTSAWENLKKALKATYEESVWEHLAGTNSAPFLAGEHGQIAVKVIDDRGNELMVVKKLTEAEG